MRNCYTLLLFLFSLGVVQSQIPEKLDFTDLDTHDLKTAFFVPDFAPFSVLKQDHLNYGMYGFQLAFKELKKADRFNKILPVDIHQATRLTTRNEWIKIGLIHADYETLHPDAVLNKQVILEHGKVKRKTKAPIFTQHTSTVVAPLTLKKIGLKSTFVLDENWLINTTNNAIKSVWVNFDDGRPRVLMTPNSPVEITYTTVGKKDIRFEIVFENGESIYRHSPLTVRYSNADLKRMFNQQVEVVTSKYQPDLGLYQEQDQSVGQAEYSIYLSEDGVLDKPVYFIDGFDPGDHRGVDDVYQMLGDFSDEIKNYGFDIVVVNFPTYSNALGNTIDGGADYIERNALSLVTIIEQINRLKIGQEKNIIIGPSMAGLISQYALGYMEKNNLEHNTRLWVSFDAPLKGANVPIGIQHLFNYFTFGLEVEALEVVVNGMLKSPAAKQMLIDHMDAHSGPISGMNVSVPHANYPYLPTGAPNFRDAFQMRMDSLGMPTTTRNIAVINGSGTGTAFKDKEGNDVKPGFSILNSTIDLGKFNGLNTRLVVKTDFMPKAGERKKIVDAKVQTQLFFWITAGSLSADAEQFSTTDGVDSAPGGLFNIGELKQSFGDDPMLDNFFNALKADYFNFIPTTSSLALTTPNYYEVLDLGEGNQPWTTVVPNDKTPFVNWFFPTSNEPHVAITSENAAFLRCEIIEPDFKLALLSSEELEVCENESVEIRLNYNEIIGCHPPALNLEVTGLPDQSVVEITPDSPTIETEVRVKISNLTPGNHRVKITPNHKTAKEIYVNLTVNPLNPNLENTLEYRINDSGAFTKSEEIELDEEDTIELRIPANLYEGQIKWLDAKGNIRGTENTLRLESVAFNENNHGQWTIRVNFDRDCGISESNIHFKLIINEKMNVNDFESHGLSIHPNPVNDYLVIKSKSLIDKNGIELVDISGRRITASVQIQSIDQQTIKLSMANLPAGIYQLIVMDKDQKRMTKKVIKK